jgi:hypothetical protein
MGSMASAAAADNIEDTIQISDDDYDMAKALYEAAVHEGGGSVLKDYYTIFEYRNRRCTFYDKLPGYGGRSEEIYKMVLRHSNEIFDEHDVHQQLEATEVRDLELARKFDVLLPLPTTTNTQTIDNFKTCPPVDGSREADEDEDEEEDVAREQDDRAVYGAEDDFEEVIEDGRDVPTPGGSSVQSTPITSPVEGTVPAFTQKIAILEDPTKVSDLSDLATPMLSSRLAPSKLDVAAPQQSAPSPLVDTIQTQKTTTSPKNFTAAPGVSSMSRYAMPAPIKSQQQRQRTPEQAKMVATKPAADLKISTPGPDKTSITGQNDAAKPVSKKQKVDHDVTKPAKPSTIDTTSQPTTDNNQPTTTPSEATNDTVAPAVVTATAHGRMSDIIAGRILPRSKQEAKDAADEQHNRLLAAYRAQNQSQSNNTRKSARQSIMASNPDPDLMPHYFSTTNFAEVNPEDPESGNVRCICGVVEDDQESMLCCKTCDAWQHTACIFPTLSKAQLSAYEEGGEDKDYWCTVCDPYTHRHVLKKLRAGQGVGSQQNDKGKGKAKK